MKVVIFSKGKEGGKNSTYKQNPISSSFFVKRCSFSHKRFLWHSYQYEPQSFTYCAMIAKWHFLIPHLLNLSQNHHWTNQGCRYARCFPIVCISTIRTGDHGILLPLKKQLTLWQKSVQNNYFLSSKSGAVKCHRLCRVLSLHLSVYFLLNNRKFIDIFTVPI